MGRRLNLAMPAMFVLFVFGLFYYTFGHDDDVAGRAGAGRWATTADEARAVPNVGSQGAAATGTAGANDDASWAGRPAVFAPSDACRTRSWRCRRRTRSTRRRWW